MSSISKAYIEELSMKDVKHAGSWIKRVASSRSKTPDDKVKDAKAKYEADRDKIKHKSVPMKTYLKMTKAEQDTETAKVKASVRRTLAPKTEAEKQRNVVFQKAANVNSAEHRAKQQATKNKSGNARLRQRLAKIKRAA